MPLLRAQVSLYNADSPVRDNVTNTFYLNVGFDPGVGGDGLAEDITELWDTLTYLNGFNRIEARLYDMADAKPRPIVARHTRTVAGNDNLTGPREVALCLSFYAGQNTPRRRGRMFMGPWSAGEMKQRPVVQIQQGLVAFAQGISGLGGVNVDWCVYSPTTGESNKVTNVWVDNEWDTQRSRGLRGDTRVAATTSG